VWSVRCGCNLTLAMMSEQKTLDRASSFREQCSFFTLLNHCVVDSRQYGKAP